MNLKAPFPWFGGKSRAASLVWERFGDVPNYVEPFCGSLAVLLGRPSPPGIETVNDLDCYVANFWRAVMADPEAVAAYADSPVNEADLQARHTWLVGLAGFKDRMKTDPEYFSAKIAGWWVWGLCCWIGSGWCANLSKKLPHLGDAGQGVHQKRPRLTHAGTGVHKIGDGTPLSEWFDALAARLRRVRVACGDWRRVLSPAVLLESRATLTGILLDPPYSESTGRAALYREEDFSVAHSVREWAIENGNNPLLRIGLCGYEGEHAMPEDWELVPWKAKGGYGSQRRDGANENAGRERIWFSPHCLPADLFSMAALG